MKTEQDYIRESVELADGFDCYDDGDGNIWVTVKVEHKNGHRYKLKDAHSGWSWLHDLLAAQLVRQVRQVAKDRRQPWLWMNMRRQVMGESLNDDVTMNTIKAIVDSGVLKDE